MFAFVEKINKTDRKKKKKICCTISLRSAINASPSTVFSFNEVMAGRGGRGEGRSISFSSHEEEIRLSFPRKDCIRKILRDDRKFSNGRKEGRKEGRWREGRELAVRKLRYSLLRRGKSFAL